jgi:NAD(P)H dehydrogenase (quinone)
LGQFGTAERKMSEITVLIIFYSRSGETEKLALAAAVGAVQARANIRLRRLSDAVTEILPECRETFDRMRKEYVPPAEPDIVSADAIIVGVPAGFTALSVELGEFLDLLKRLAPAGKLEGKVAAIFSSRGNIDDASEASLMSVSTAILRLGFITMPPVALETRSDRVDHAVAQGRKVAMTARALKRAS